MGDRVGFEGIPGKDGQGNAYCLRVNSQQRP